MLYDFQAFRDRQHQLTTASWNSTDRINFLLYQYPQLSRAKPAPAIGEYLKAANLLSDCQIAEILAQQKYLKLRFGEIAVKNRWLNPQVLEFFLELKFVVDPSLTRRLGD